jgi:DNA-binding GntR family transcriptional regulator
MADANDRWLLRERVADALREAITSGELAPGHRLREERLADQHGVSRVPVREALRQLAAEGFVEIRPNRGAVVAQLTAREAEGLLEVREVLEVLVAGQAAERRTAAQLGVLRAVLDEARGALAAGRARDLVRLNGRFHGVLAEASGNPVAARLVAELRSRIDWVYAADVDAQAGDSWAEHAAIVEALADRDAVRAEALVRAHLRRAQGVFRRPDPEDGAHAADTV